MITLNTTKSELKARWKQMYQTRKKFGPNGVLPSLANYGYFTGKMESTACLLLHSIEKPTRKTKADVPPDAASIEARWTR